MRQPPAVVAVLCSDLHLSQKAPLARSCEGDWYAVQTGYLKQLHHLAKAYKCPVVIAGDLFDRWNSPPEIITLALKHLPDNCYCVPGQHDLPNHSYQDMKRSAYGVLVEAGKIRDLQPGKPVEVEGTQPLRLWGFPWGFPVSPLEHPQDMLLEVAVVHAYIWRKGHGYLGAPKESRLARQVKNLQGYDVALYGDNHMGWWYEYKNLTVWNNGYFMRRKSDERYGRPTLGVLRADGTVKPHYLDVDGDKFLEADGSLEALNGIGFESFLEELAALGGCAIDFTEAVKRLLERDKVAPGVRKIILGALEG